MTAVLLVGEGREYLREPGERLETDLGYLDVPDDIDDIDDTEATYDSHDNNEHTSTPPPNRELWSRSSSSSSNC